MTTEAPRVVVTDVEQRAALAACRGLDRAGYRVTGVAGARPAAGHWSRCCARRVTLPAPDEQPGDFLVGLEALVRSEPHALLVPTTDLSTWLISENRSRFEGSVLLALPSRSSVRAALDKSWLLAAAAAAGLGGPPAGLCASVEDGLAVARELGFPLVVKPVRRRDSDQVELAQLRVVLADDEPSLAHALDSLPSPFVVQRYAESARVVSFSGVIAPGGLIATAVVRWSRRWPPDRGGASFCETIAPPDGLARRVEQLLASIDFTGMFELELLELQGRRYGAIDLNPRPFGWLALPTAAGANLAASYCDWLLDGAVTHAVAAAGVRYRWEDGELRHLAWQLRRGRLGKAAAVLRPHRRVVHPHFEAADPAPLAARLILLARLWFRLRRARLTRRRERPVDACRSRTA